jgi:DNA polymerase III delta prime subunit
MTDEARVVPRVPQPEERSSPDWSPQRLADIVGQTQAVQRLKPLVELSRERGQPLPHILLVGAEGTGKRTLAAALANEMGASLVASASPTIQNGADLVGILTNLAERATNRAEVWPLIHLKEVATNMLLNRPVSDNPQEHLERLRQDLDSWEANVLSALERLNAPATDISHFKTLKTFPNRGLPGWNAAHVQLRNMIAEKLDRLDEITRRLE